MKEDLESIKGDFVSLPTLISIGIISSLIIGISSIITRKKYINKLLLR